MPYTMHIEKPANVVKQHGFHLGTDRNIAESFVLERLRNDSGVISIALRFDGKLDRIYDWRDVTEFDYSDD
jgi:hypothetical protein